MALTARFSSWPISGRPSGYVSYPLGPEAAEFYRDNGYLVVEGVFDQADIDALNAETLALCRGQRGAIGGLPDSLPEDSDAEILRRVLCIHFPNRRSELMHQQTVDPRLAHVLTALIGPNVKCMQQMLFIKASGKPGQAWHQDEHYIPTRDRSLTGAWLALDDATIENGCLWVVPGSHRSGVLWPTRYHHDKRFDCAYESFGYPNSEDPGVPVEVAKGSIVLFNGYLLHRSLPNRANSGYRRSLVNHYMSAESLLPWMPPGQGDPGMGELDFRDIWMVAGNDPYASKGTVVRSGCHVRPSGEGGCGNPVHNVASQAATPRED